MELALALVGIALVVLAVTAAAERLRISPPLMLIAAGVVVALIGGSIADDYSIFDVSPELVLIGILPPLLYSAAYNTSFVDFRRNRRALISLSVGLVVFTTFVVGFVAAWLLPGLPLAAGFALGAIIAPPDAVAATAVARRVRMPRSIVQLLEGESLVNDATALTAFRSAVIAIGGTVTAFQIGVLFVVAAAGGVVIGVVVALIYLPIRRRVKQPTVDTILSFTVPFIAYVPAEEVHASGVLAVVVAGLLVGHKAPLISSGTTRITAEANWRTVAFLLENAVFLLIGLQLPGIVQAIGPSSEDWLTIAIACVGIFIAAVLARVVWVFADGALSRIKIRGRQGRTIPWPELAVVSWAGMRGVVTLAGALLIPEEPETEPYRSVLILIAFAVVAGSILIQGSSLPWLVRRLSLKAPDPAEDALQEAALLDEASRAGQLKLEEITDPDDSAEVVARAKSRAVDRSNAAWERVAAANPTAETPMETYRRLRLGMLAAEREAVLQARDDGRTNDEVLKAVVRTLDIEEAMLDAPISEERESDEELVTPTLVARSCSHLAAAQRSEPPAPQTPGECGACIQEGTSWVYLRLCLTCGNVGCCDSSPRKHASAHHSETTHPVMQSAEQGEAWRWCFVDDILG